MFLTPSPTQKISELRRQKMTLRAAAKNFLAEMDRSEVTLRSGIMRKILYTSPFWKTARSVLLFAPIASEPDLLPSIFREKDIYCLKSLNSHYEPVALSSLDDLKLGPRGIREPISQEIFPLKQIDLIVVPGLAFDRKGGRLGRGGGHYDRILGRPDCIGTVIGTCFSSQLVREVPREDHDSLVSVILTEEGLLSVRNNTNDAAGGTHILTESSMESTTTAPDFPR